MASPIRKKRMSLAEAEELASRDKRKIILMSVAMVIILGAFLFSQLDASNKRKAEEQEQENLTGRSEEPAPPRSLPQLTDSDRAPLENVHDDSNEGKQFVDDAALQLVLDYSNFWVPQHYAEAGTRDLTPEVYAEIEADPATKRMQPFRVRGVVTEITQRERPNGSYPEWHGQIEVEDGGHAAFVVTTPPANTGVSTGDFAMLQGLFLQIFRYEGAEDWIEAPLLCGHAISPSFERIVPGPDMPTPLLATVTDDVIGGGIAERPWAAEWELMARAAAEDTGTDWASAPLLNTETINQVLADGEAYRGKPFRLPISINQGARSLRVDENPLRLERVTEAWIGNQTWKSDSPVILVNLPEDRPELGGLARYNEEEAKYLEAELYFFRNFLFETSRGQPGRSPIFIAHSLTAVVPEPSPWPRRIMWAMLGATGILILLIWSLLRRDRAQSQRLQEELIRRRRARREKAAAAAAEGGAASG